MPKTVRILGIHLAGAHTRKSCAVRASTLLNECRSGVEAGPLHALYCRGLSGRFEDLPRVSENDLSVPPRLNAASEGEADATKAPNPLIWEAYSADIGPSPHRDSDSRFIEVVSDMGPVDVVILDAPLTLPPCVSCDLPCPGTTLCPVPEVVLMRQAWEERRQLEADARVAQGKKAFRREKRVRIPQPYLDRAFEVFARNHYEHPILSGTFEIEAALGSNRAPVTARSRRLQRELLARFPGVLLLETNPALATLGWSLSTGYKVGSLLEMKSTQSGRSARAGLLKRLEQRRMAVRGASLHEILFADFASNPGVFHAAMAALTAWGLFSGEISLHEEFLSLNPDSPFRGWACVPKEAANYAWGH
ncbi:MAG: hypothetical protein IOD12_00575 [Silvanigrellales bacterium]|nr:hypothetical protein [Silvanigrellales bacterium]